MGDGQQFLCLSAHRLVVDNAPWDIIVTDLGELLLSRPPKLLLHSPSRSGCKPIQNKAGGWGGGGDDGVNGTIFSIPAEKTTVLLGSANQAFGRKPEELIHAALLYSFARVFPDRDLPIIYSEDHGRDPGDSGLDPTRTVGWFSYIWPAHVNLKGDHHELVEYVSRTKDGRRQAEGRPNTIVGGHSAGPNEWIEVLFNFDGLVHQQKSVHGLFQKMSHNESSAMTDLGTKTTNFSLFSISAEVTNAQLQIGIFSHRPMKSAGTADKWAGACEEALWQMALHLPSRSPAFTLDMSIRTLPIKGSG
ncbi:hypothetical protein EYZ11_009399 [Aspergillus tanneri]|uniref:Uncharacterized protein n=1 Tax=Aspergillus tanneri TaxID=1220188 RepID=A0A4S3J808_9EURO|nr:hypothetical protein EYZ11_009399 [Aspergillus tanneri]